MAASKRGCSPCDLSLLNWQIFSPSFLHLLSLCLALLTREFFGCFPQLCLCAGPWKVCSQCPGFQRVMEQLGAALCLAVVKILTRIHKCFLLGRFSFPEVNYQQLSANQLLGLCRCSHRVPPGPAEGKACKIQSSAAGTLQIPGCEGRGLRCDEIRRCPSGTDWFSFRGEGQ